MSGPFYEVIFKVEQHMLGLNHSGSLAVLDTFFSSFGYSSFVIEHSKELSCYKERIIYTDGDRTNDDGAVLVRAYKDKVVIRYPQSVFSALNSNGIFSKINTRLNNNVHPFWEARVD